MKKIITDGYLIGMTATGNELSDEDVLAVEHAIKNIPEPRDGFIRKLRADTLNWEYVETDADPDPDIGDDEFIDILTGGLGVA